MSSAYFYDAEGRDRVANVRDVGEPNELKKQQLIWFDVERDDKETLDLLRDRLELRDEAIEVVISKKFAPGLSMYEDYFHFRLLRAGEAGDAVDFIVARKWLITVRGNEVPYLDEYHEKDRGESLIGQLTPLALAASLTDWHFEEYETEAANAQRRLDVIEGGILGRRKLRPPLQALASIRRSGLHLRMRLGSHRRLIRGLVRPDFLPGEERGNEEFLKLLEAHFNRSAETLDRLRDAVTASFELYATQTTQDTNRLVRLLTLITVATGFSAAIAGIFGMNFDIPFFHTGSVGFLTVTSVVVVAALAILLFSRFMDWI